MKIEIGDLLFCHTVGNKYGFQINQLGIITEGNKRQTRFRIFLGSGRFSEVTQIDLDKGNVEIISKAKGPQVNTRLKIIPALSKAMSSN
tara:strand:- start:288 stop:554 length:267 start_codon:yes stop_codon:yes gene_type:complete